MQNRYFLRKQITCCISTAAAIFIFAHPVQGNTFSVTTTNDSGTGSLREAISFANTNPGPNTINFQFAGTPPFTIKLASALPPITNALTIDGATQSGYTNAPLVELNGAGAGATTAGLQLNSGSSASALIGLAITRFGAEGIRLISASNTIQGCFIGTDTTGTNAFVGNTNYGISIFSAGNTIGPGNVISGNAYAGILLSGNAATGNKIIGNLIGTDASGKATAGNKFDGIYLTNAIANQIGGTNTGAGNVISGNFRNGILLFGGSVSNTLQGNLIGLAAGGTNALKNFWDGIFISGGSANTIGGKVNNGRNIISGNGTNGVFIGLTNDSYNLIAGNYIGTDITGKTNIPNGQTGMKIQGCNNIIGGVRMKGDSVSGGNVISGNGQRGIWLTGNNGSAAGNSVLGNHIGLDATGTNSLGNGNAGIHIDSAAGNTIGPGNTISANTNAGIYFSGGGTAGNLIWGNYIGTDTNGASARANRQEGIYAFSVSGAGNNIGPSNVISGNALHGIFLTNSWGFSIIGNKIGLNTVGTSAIMNANYGIVIYQATNTNWIGGSLPDARNIISGNGFQGILVLNSTAQIIQGNYIGTAASGGTAIPNGKDGIWLQNAVSNVIGGTATGAGNLISGNNKNYLGNGYDGLYFINSSKNIIQGNFIGLAADGFNRMTNSAHNVEFDAGSTNNILGGTSAGAGNHIAFAEGGYCGVRVRDYAFNNLISGNIIFSNSGLGIDLGTYGTNGIIHLENGVASTSANHSQNFPTLTNAISGTATLIRGSFDSATNRTYALEFFASPHGNASGYGEGQVFLGQTSITIGTISPTNFSVVIPATVAAGWVITATATDPANNTSEFSHVITNWGVPLLQLGTNPAAGQFKVSWTNSSGSFSLVESTNLNPPVQWDTSSLPLTLSNGIYSVPVNATNRTTFFRLLAQ